MAAPLDGSAIVSLGSPGLRERKRAATRLEIRRVALAIFIERGFEATTLNMIADGAGISRRTIFHYFASKEAILSDWEDGLEATLREAIFTQPKDSAALDIVRHALSKLIATTGAEQSVALDRLMRSTEALRARKLANYGRYEQSLLAALLELFGSAERETEARLAAMVGVGVLRIATAAWSEAGGARTLSSYLAEGFRQLRKTFVDMATESLQF